MRSGIGVHRKSVATLLGWALLLAATPLITVHAATIEMIPLDLHYLVGKHVVVGRTPLCERNTYNADLNHAGKIATVIAFKENATIPTFPAQTLARIPPAMKDTLTDQKNGGMLVLEFADGTTLDTCGNQGLKAITSNFQLAQGETIEVPDAAPAPPSLAAVIETPKPVVPNDTCPVAITRVNSGTTLGHILLEILTESRFEQELDRAANGGLSKHYLDIGIRNNSNKAIAGVEVRVAYTDNMADETGSASYVSPNSAPIEVGDSFTYSAMDRRQASRNGNGDVTVAITRIRFTDETFWKDNGSRSCSTRTKID